MECLPLAGLMKNLAGDDPDSLDATDEDEGPFAMALDLQGLTCPMQETVGEVGSSSSSLTALHVGFTK